MTIPQSGTIHFFERQNFWRNTFVLVLMAITCLVTLAICLPIAALQPSTRSTMGLVIAISVVIVPVVILSWRMTTRIDNEHLCVRFFPFSKRYPLADIATVEVGAFHPLAQCGGWGARWTRKYGWCYVMAGDRAVFVTTHSGKKLVIGSLRADELAQVLSAAAGLPDPLAEPTDG
ncbi:MAG: hypothetical protein KF866_08865 [Phycisphaeraceae bacterium]|nr:hypothetical protein [Phycisphaeraceae bacterium]MCW5753989.1 hypothetical protein [Phycisphaeraceae bacterium]